MQVNSKMYILHLLEGGRSKASKKGHNLNGGEYQLLSVLVAACLLYLSAVVSAADSNDWKSSVPKSSYAPPLSMYKTRNSQIRNMQNKQKIYSHNHDPDHLLNHQHNKFSSAREVPTANPSSWYSSQSNDPRMGFFFADSASSSSSISSLSSTPQQAVVPQPRSLSSLPSPTPTSYYPTTTNSSKISKSKKKKKQNKKRSRAIKTSTTANNALVAAAPKNDVTTFEETGTSRTFFLTPLLAYLFPVFIAQMFGMGMIPAAALIMLPIFLLPLGLTAAIFLI